jgi:hypothetical protein
MAKLIAPDFFNNDYFGYKHALVGDESLLVSAYLSDGSSGVDSGVGIFQVHIPDISATLL